MAYDEIDPIGKERDEYGWAAVCSTMVNVATSMFAKKGQVPKQVLPEDFLPDWGSFKKEQKENIPPQSVDDMKRAILSIASMQNRKRIK